MMNTWVPRLAGPAVLLLASVLAADTAWWDAKWSCRREIVFPQDAPATAFEVVFPNHGVGRPDGGDVRVVTGGVPVPVRVLSVGPGDLVHLVFERRGTAPHHVYWDNPAATAPADPAVAAKAAMVESATTIRAGCLLEVKSYAGTEIDSLVRMRATWAASRESQGRRFVSNIHFAHNPLGPNENFLSHFVGWLRCDREGTYLFATDSDDASFVLIDGKLVTEWPGRHWGSAQVRFTGATDLTAGVHRIDYLHAQSEGGVLMTAAWKPPGAGQVTVIPPEAFVGVGRAAVKRIERRGQDFIPDFVPAPVGQAVLDPDATEFIVRVHFENLADEETLKTHSCRWFFGDGTTAADASPDHVFLMTGDYDVTLVMVKGYDEKKVTMKVHVGRDWSRQASAIDLRESYYDIVKTYDISRMEPKHAYRAMYYFERVARRDDVVRAGRVILSRENGLPEETLYDAVALYAETMRIQGKDYKAARDMLLGYEKRMKHPEHAAGLALAAGDIAMWHLKDLEAAEADYRRVIFTYAEKAQKMTLRRALVRMGDIYRWAHDGTRAREFLHKAQSIPVDDRSVVQRSLRAGYLARSIEDFLTRGDMEFAYDFLIQWAWEFPEDQLDGYWTELRVRWLIRNKEYPGGVAEVESLLKLNPKSPYAPSLLWLAADCAEASGDRTKTGRLLERVLTDYPEALNKKAVVERLEGAKQGK